MSKRYLPLLVFAALIGLLLSGNMRTPPLTSTLTGKAFPQITLEAKELSPLLAGHVTLVNVFASWCPPCAMEHPQLMQLRAKNIVPIVGIAWKDSPEKIQKWLQKHGNPYHYLLNDVRGDATLSLSLTGVPESFIVDAQGMIVYHTTQPITPERLERDILPLLERLTP